MRKILDALKGALGEKLISMVLSVLLTKDNILKGIDAILDYAEDLAAKTSTKFDDEALKKVRQALSIPEFDK